MSDMVLNIPPDYVSCFAVVLRVMLGIDICETDYNIHAKLRIFPLFRSHTWKYNIHANKRLTKVKEKWYLFGLMFFIFISFSSLQCQTISCKLNWGVLIFTRIKLVARVLAIARIKWKTVNPLIKFTYGSASTEFKDILPWKTVPISTKIVKSYAIKRGIPFWIWQKLRQQRDKNFPMEGKPLLNKY